MRSCLLAVVLGSLLVACGHAGAPAPDYGSAPAHAVSPEAAQWLLTRARARLDGEAPPATAGRQPIPREVVAPRPATVFITAFRHGPGQPPAPIIGAGGTLAAALDVALEAMSSRTASREGETAGARPTPDRIQIDVLDRLEPIDRTKESDLAARSAAEFLDLGAEGVVMENGGQRRYLLPAEVIYRSIAAGNANDQSADDLLDRAVEHLGLARGIWRFPDVTLSRLRTIAFVEDHTRSRALSVVRGTVPLEEPNRARLLAAARSGGDYLVRMQREDGRFYYAYNPRTDRVDARGYNILRHAGTAFALFELYGTTREARYLDAGRRAVTFLKSRFRPARDSAALYVLDDDGSAKLGGNGLALLALTKQMEVDPGSADPESAERLAALIRAMQQPDGSFDSYYRIRGDEPAGSVSLFYPGEAMLGLVHLFMLNGDSRLLDSARRGAVHLIESQRELDRLPSDAWFMQALEALHRIDPEPKYAAHAMALADAIIARQYPATAPAGYAGGYGPGIPRSTPAAARAEGLLAAYRIARAIGEPRGPRIAAALRASARFQLAQQFDADNGFFLPNPGRATGGFRAGLTAMRVRIDYVQHNISSLLGIAAALY